MIADVRQPNLITLEEVMHVTHWIHIEGFPDTEFGNARFYDEGELTDEHE